MRQNFENRGFTLIELMIVVAIVAVLASLAVPTFTYFRLRAKTAEALTLVGGIRVAQESFYAENDNYADIQATTPTNLPGDVKQAWVTTPCPLTCDRDNTPDCNTFDCIGFSTGSVYYRYASPHLLATATDPGEYAIGGESDLDLDGDTGSFAYRSANGGGLVGYIYDGISACPFDELANIITNCTPVEF